MEDSRPDQAQDLSPEEARLRNLRAVAQHHVQGRKTSEQLSAETRVEDGTHKWRKRLATWGPVGIVLAFVLGKGKFLIPLLKVTKLSTVLTMFVSVWAYALLWGWQFGLGFVLLIFVHELGHALVMQRLGIPAGAPVFIPFVGAVIAMKGYPKNAWIEALVGIGGPVAGGLGALVCLAVGYLGGSPFWFALAYVGFMLNLFNLIPVSPLDGGRIVGVISRWFWVAGYAIGIVMFLQTWSPILGLILIFGLLGIGRTLRGPTEGYFDVAPARRQTMSLAYFGLLALLGLGMWASDLELVDLRKQLEEARETAEVTLVE